MDSISMYFMIVAASSYSKIANMFESDSPSDIDVGTVAAISTSMSDMFASDDTDRSQTFVGLLGSISTSTSAMFASDDTDRSQTFVGLLGSISTSTSAMFASDLDVATISQIDIQSPPVVAEPTDASFNSVVLLLNGE